ncbi:MAG: ATP-dependent helicase C-terminal domain-containing protein [Bacteriovorax sp.]|jgi:ATP-dependent helicase HrpB
MQLQILLPIDEIKDKILQAFRTHANIIIKASPGSGKTTRVPLYLLKETPKKIYILEPRRLAAKLAAQQVANELGEKVGESVGYIFRYERKISEQTRILFLTEGTFLKILSQNKNLEDVGLIILDEFHERHLSTDAALSFVTRLQKENRPDLKILVMSATIETKSLQNFLEMTASACTLELVSHRFPLVLSYLSNTTGIIQAPLSKKIRNCVEEILSKDMSGDILVFLPGMREIREAEEALATLCASFDVQCLVLHGDLDANDQDLVLKASKLRKIILSTNIAESSVTIAGIRIVVDSGLQRESSYNFFSGLPELKITKISRASATQRAGRANRQGPGQCFRLYSELDFDQRPYLQKPEILKSDLSELYLQALSLFNVPLENLSWIEVPPESAINNSRELLISLNAIDDLACITQTGQKILKYPLHPRIGKILCETEKCTSNSQNEILSFLAEFLGEKNKERFRKLIHLPAQPGLSKKDLEELLLSGFPDRVARARGEKYFDVITQNGDTLKIAREISHEFDPNHPLWIVLDLNNKGEVSRCLAIDESWLYDLVPFPVTEEIKYAWDEKKSQVVQSERTMLGKIILSESRIVPKISTEGIRAILVEKAGEFLKSLHETQEYERLLTLNKLLKKIDLHVSEVNLLKDFFSNQVHFDQEDKKELSVFYFITLKEMIDPEGIYNLDLDFPMTIQLTDRRKIPIIYDRTQDPFIESLIQDFYGLSRTPILAKGKIPLTLKLLGPHKLAIQVTQDLASFWNKTYPKIVKELSRDYPRHYWPEDPQNAKPFLLKRQVPV